MKAFWTKGRGGNPRKTVRKKTFSRGQDRRMPVGRSVEGYARNTARRKKRDPVINVHLHAHDFGFDVLHISLLINLPTDMWPRAKENDHVCSLCVWGHSQEEGEGVEPLVDSRTLDISSKTWDLILAWYRYPFLYSKRMNQTLVVSCFARWSF